MNRLFCLGFLLASIMLSPPAHAQEQRRQPVLDNVAGDFIHCAMFYTVSGTCLAKMPGVDKNLIAKAGMTASQLLASARRIYQKEGLAVGGGDKLEVQKVSNERQTRLLKEVGADCAELDAFMDKYGADCRRVSSNPDAYLNEKVSQGK